MLTTVKGVLEFDVITDDSGNSYKVFNLYYPGKYEGFFLIDKFDDEYWRVLRRIIIRVIN